MFQRWITHRRRFGHPANTAPYTVRNMIVMRVWLRLLVVWRLTDVGDALKIAFRFAIMRLITGLTTVRHDAHH